MKLTNSKRHGFTLVEIMIVVAIIGLLAAIAIPNFVKARTTAQLNACINNLRQIDAAKQQWALENHQPVSAPAPAKADLMPYMGHGSAGSVAACPADPTQTFDASYGPGIGDLNTSPTCAIVPATHKLPTD